MRKKWINLRWVNLIKPRGGWINYCDLPKSKWKTKANKKSTRHWFVDTEFIHVQYNDAQKLALSAREYFKVVRLRYAMNCEHLRISNSTNFLFLLSHVKSGRILFLSTLAESRTARFNTNKAARILTLTLIRHFSANGCLLPLCAVDGMAVTTVEGIGSTKTALHPVQVNTVSMGRYD